MRILTGNVGLVSPTYERLEHADDSFAMRLPCVVFIYFDFVGQTWSRTNKQGNYLSKNYLFHYAVILPRRSHSQTVIWVDLKGKVEVGASFGNP